MIYIFFIGSMVLNMILASACYYLASELQMAETIIKGARDVLDPEKEAENGNDK